MVFKDAVGTKQAQIELAEVEKQLLLTLKNNNPNKNAAPKPVNLMAPPYLLPFDIELAEPMPAYPKYKPQEMHCLKKLLEQDYTVEPSCMLHEDLEQCKCKNNFYPEVLDSAVTKYIQEQYKKYLDKIKQKKQELIADGYSANNFSESEPESDEEDTSDDEDDADGSNTPKVNINII